MFVMHVGWFKEENNAKKEAYQLWRYWESNCYDSQYTVN